MAQKHTREHLIENGFKLKTPYTRERLIRDFTDLGIKKRDTLFIHSSFKSLGPVEGGAGTVISALEAVIGQDGLLLMPTFSLLPSREERVAAWDVATTPSHGGMVDGVFSADARHLSLRPLFARRCCARERCGRSVCSQITSDVKATNRRGILDPWGKTYGTHSPMFRAYKSDAKLLMIGVDYQTSTYIHLVEVIHWNKRLAGTMHR